jgi:hypothetical protein
MAILEHHFAQVAHEAGDGAPPPPLADDILSRYDNPEVFFFEFFVSFCRRTASVVNILSIYVFIHTLHTSPQQQQQQQTNSCCARSRISGATRCDSAPIAGRCGDARRKRPCTTSCTTTTRAAADLSLVRNK